MEMLGPNMPYLLKMYYFRFFLNYLSPKWLFKDSVTKMHEVLILDVFFDAWA